MLMKINQIRKKCAYLGNLRPGVIYDNAIKLLWSFLHLWMTKPPCICGSLHVRYLCRSVLSNAICPYLIFTLLTLQGEERRGEDFGSPINTALLLPSHGNLIHMLKKFQTHWQSPLCSINHQWVQDAHTALHLSTGQTLFFFSTMWTRSYPL